MPSVPNPYEPSSSVASLTERRSSLRFTRVVVAVFLLFILLRAVIQLATSVMRLATTSPPSTEAVETTLFPPELADALQQGYRYQVTSCIRGIGFGTAWVLIAVLAWRCQRRFFRTAMDSSNGLDLNGAFRRCALYGFAASCIGVVGREAFMIDPWPLLNAILLWVLSVSMLLGFGSSVAVASLGCELRIRVRDAALPYSVAILGVLIPAYPLYFAARPAIEDGWRRIQAFIENTI